jgi:hypothetical protein
MDMTSKVQPTTTKNMDKWDYMKLKSFCTVKETTVKRQPTE